VRVLYHTTQEQVFPSFEQMTLNFSVDLNR
jgi:hypothetical protein